MNPEAKVSITTVPPDEEAFWHIHALEFSGGQRVELRPDSILVLVGSNNCGKSQSLRDIENLLSGTGRGGVCVKAASGMTRGSSEALLKTLSSLGRERNLHLDGYWGEEHRDSILRQWSDGRGNAVWRIFGTLLTTESRLELTKNYRAIPEIGQIAKTSWQALQTREDMQVALNRSFRTAFRTDITVYQGPGQNAPAFVGPRPSPDPALDEDRVSPGFLERLTKLPKLQEQGDGMRSFAGLLIEARAGMRSCLLIDEPEAFLHPPQVRVLARELCDATKGRQLVVATHSGDFLREIVDAAKARCVVVRLVRAGEKNHATVLQGEELGRLWKDPLLHHSQVLDSVFHELCVCCEADSDCRFYAAINRLESAKDCLFCHVGGKSRLHVVGKALGVLGVRCAAVVDIDILNDMAELRRLVESFGGTWAQVSSDATDILSFVRALSPPRTLNQVRDEIGSILGEAKTQWLGEDEIKAIRDTLKQVTAWSHVKQFGLVSFSGPTRHKAERLLGKLAEWGIFVVSEGELEGFYRKCDAHGPPWVNAVLECSLATDPDFESAREFVKRVVAF